MTKKISFSLVCPDSELASGEAWQVVVPGSEGEFGVLADHAPLVSCLQTGMARILQERDGQERCFWIRGGFAEISVDGLLVLTEEARELSADAEQWVKEELERSSEEPERLHWLEGLKEALTRH